MKENWGRGGHKGTPKWQTRQDQLKSLQTVRETRPDTENSKKPILTKIEFSARKGYGQGTDFEKLKTPISFCERNFSTRFFAPIARDTRPTA